LDTLADRIDGLINALKVRGVFDASASELNRLFSEGENNTLIPVKNWGAFAEKQGLRGAIDLVDIQPFASALMSCYQAMDQVKGQIYEIMGIADIQRGQTDPNETLGAQIIKSNNAAGRLKTMQHNVVNFATKILNLKAQIICKHFTEETIVRISGAAQLSDQDKQLVPQALMLLKDESAKNFRIEVTSDSMIYQDEMQEKQDRMEFLQAVGNFMQNIIPLGQNAPELVPMAMEMLKFGVTGFKVGKGLEGLIDETADKLKEMAAQPKQPQPNPEMMKIQAQSQAKQAEMQMSAQIEQQKIQAQMQAETNKQQMQAQENSLRNQLEHERQQADREMEMKLAQMKMMTERNTQLLLAYINNGAKVEVARIGKSMDDGALAFDEYQNDADMMQAQEHPLAPIANAISQSNQQMTDTIGQLIGTLQQQHAMSNRPKQVLRDEQGKIVGVQ
jgi:hypothetical protein